MSRLQQAALLLLVFSQAYGQSSEQFLTVARVAGWTPTGERIEKIWVVLSSRDGKDKYAASGRDVRLSVPAGDYLLRVEAPGFQSKLQTLKAYQPTVFRSVALPVERLHGQAASGLKGAVQNYSGNLRDLRVKFDGAVWRRVAGGGPKCERFIQVPG